MTDYGSMSNDELRMEIAKRLGYYVGAPPKHTKQNYFSLYNAKGAYLKGRSGDVAWDTEELAFAAACPRWPTSVDVALTLLDDLYWRFENDNYSMTAEYHGLSAIINKSGNIQHDLARAICLSWLYWQNAQKNSPKRNNGTALNSSAVRFALERYPCPIRQ